MTDAAQLEATIGSAFGLPSDVYVVLAEGPALEPLLETNERLAQRLATELPGMAVQPPTRLLPSAAAQARTVARIGQAQAVAGARCGRRSSRRAWPAASRPARSIRSSARLPRLLDPAERLSYDGYVAHGLGDLIDRFVVRDGQTLDAGDLRVSVRSPTRRRGVRADCRRGRSGADADRAAAGQPRAGARLSAAVPEGARRSAR